MVHWSDTLVKEALSRVKREGLLSSNTFEVIIILAACLRICLYHRYVLFRCLRVLQSLEHALALHVPLHRLVF